jgi:hypothetical protein
LADQGKRIFQKFLDGNSKLLKEKVNPDASRINITQPDETIVFR